MGKIVSVYSLGNSVWNQQPVDLKKTGDIETPRPDSPDSEIISNPQQDPVDPGRFQLSQSVHETGAVDAFVQGNAKVELEEIDGRTFDVTTAEGALEMLTESVQGAIDQFVEHGLKETLERVKSKLDGPGGGSSRGNTARLEELADKIRSLRKEEARFIYQAIAKARSVLKAVRGDGDPAAAKGKLSLKSSERTARCEEACDALRRAVRNFRYNFDQVCHAKNGKSEDVSWTRKLRQFFSASHTELFALISRQDVQHFGKATIEALEEKELEFMWTANRLLTGDSRRRDVSLSDFSVTSYETAKRFSDTLHRINEANRQLNGESFEIYQLQAAKAALDDIARNGGSQTLEFSGGVGVGFSLPADLQRVAAGAKLRHTVCISGRGDGSVTVQVLTEVEAGAKTKAGFGDVAQVKLDAKAAKTLSAFNNRSETFTDVDSAAQFLASGSSDWAAKLSSTVGGRGKLAAGAMLWAKVKSWFSKGNVFDERAYVESMKERNVFRSCDDVLRRRRNAVTSATRTISRPLPV